jgi:hypothetical protein
MKYISALLARLRPMQMFLSIVFAVVLVFSSGCSADTAKDAAAAKTAQINNVKDNLKRGFPASAKSPLTKGTVQLDKIEEKAEEAIDSPANSLETIVERSQGSLNEVQSGAADSDKMNRSNTPKLPSGKMKNS